MNAAVSTAMHAINLARQFSATRSEADPAVRQRPDQRHCSDRPDWTGGLLLTGEPDRFSQRLDLPAGRLAAHSFQSLDAGFRGGNRIRNASDTHALRPARHARRARRHRQPQRPTAHEPARRLGSRPHMLKRTIHARLHAGRSAGCARAHARGARGRGHRPRPEHPVRTRIRHAAHGDPPGRIAGRGTSRARSRVRRTRFRPTRRRLAAWSEAAVASLPAGSTARVELAARRAGAVPNHDRVARRRPRPAAPRASGDPVNRARRADAGRSPGRDAAGAGRDLAARPRSSRAGARRIARANPWPASRNRSMRRSRMLADEIRLAGYLGLAPPGTAVDGSSALGAAERPDLAVAGGCGASLALDLGAPVGAVDAAYAVAPGVPLGCRASPNGRAAAAADTLVMRHAAIEPSPAQAGRLQLETNLRAARAGCGRQRRPRRRRATPRPRSERVLREQRLDRASRLALVAPQAAGRRDAAGIPGRGTRERHCGPADCDRSRRPGGCGRRRSTAGSAPESRRGTACRGRCASNSRHEATWPSATSPASAGRKRVARVVELRNTGLQP